MTLPDYAAALNVSISAALDIAVSEYGRELRKFADPTEGARAVTLSEAHEIAHEDPGLIEVVGASVDPRN